MSVNSTNNFILNLLNYLNDIPFLPQDIEKLETEINQTNINITNTVSNVFANQFENFNTLVFTSIPIKSHLSNASGADKVLLALFNATRFQWKAETVPENTKALLILCDELLNFPFDEKKADDLIWHCSEIDLSTEPNWVVYLKYCIVSLENEKMIPEILRKIVPLFAANAIWRSPGKVEGFLEEGISFSLSSKLEMQSKFKDFAFLFEKNLSIIEIDIVFEILSRIFLHVPKQQPFFKLAHQLLSQRGEINSSICIHLNSSLPEEVEIEAYDSFCHVVKKINSFGSKHQSPEYNHLLKNCFERMQNSFSLLSAQKKIDWYLICLHIQILLKQEPRKTIVSLLKEENIFEELNGISDRIRNEIAMPISFEETISHCVKTGNKQVFFNLQVLLDKLEKWKESQSYIQKVLLENASLLMIDYLSFLKSKLERSSCNIEIALNGYLDFSYRDEGEMLYKDCLDANHPLIEKIIAEKQLECRYREAIKAAINKNVKKNPLSVIPFIVKNLKFIDDHPLILEIIQSLYKHFPEKEEFAFQIRDNLQFIHLKILEIASPLPFSLLRVLTFARPDLHPQIYLHLFSYSPKKLPEVEDLIEICMSNISEEDAFKLMIRSVEDNNRKIFICCLSKIQNLSENLRKNSNILIVDRWIDLICSIRPLTSEEADVLANTAIEKKSVEVNSSLHQMLFPYLSKEKKEVYISHFIKIFREIISGKNSPNANLRIQEPILSFLFSKNEYDPFLNECFNFFIKKNHIQQNIPFFRLFVNKVSTPKEKKDFLSFYISHYNFFDENLIDQRFLSNEILSDFSPTFFDLQHFFEVAKKVYPEGVPDDLVCWILEKMNCFSPSFLHQFIPYINRNTIEPLLQKKISVKNGGETDLISLISFKFDIINHCPDLEECLLDSLKLDIDKLINFKISSLNETPLSSICLFLENDRWMGSSLEMKLQNLHALITANYLYDSLPSKFASKEQKFERQNRMHLFLNHYLDLLPELVFSDINIDIFLLNVLTNFSTLSSIKQQVEKIEKQSKNKVEHPPSIFIPHLAHIKDRLIYESKSVIPSQEASILSAVIWRFEGNLLSYFSYPEILIELVEQIHLPRLENLEIDGINYNSVFKEDLQGLVSFRMYATLYGSRSNIKQLNKKIEKFLEKPKPEDGNGL